MRPVLEICVDSPDGLAAAVRGGADRIELCAALDVGGLTPSGSLIRAAAGVPCPVHLLVRPRAGDFHYSPACRRLVEADLIIASDAGLEGVAIGASRDDGRLDMALLACWLEQARALGTARGAPMSVTLHRAFDLAPDLGDALDAAIELGFDRVLTSGGAVRAIDGVGALAMLQTRAAGRIGIIAGSGVAPDVLPAILSTGVREIHASCRAPLPLPCDAPERRFGFVVPNGGDTSQARVRALANLLQAA